VTKTLIFIKQNEVSKHNRSNNQYYVEGREHPDIQQDTARKQC